MTYPNPGCCIHLSNGAQIPLEGVHIKARLLGLCSEVTVAHRYRNTESVPLEAVYTFPLETGAAVCGFEAQVGDRRVVGKVLERDEAFERYDDAMADGHGAFLLDQERPNIFTASLGNLKPGQEVTVQIKYVALLNLEGDAVRFMLPTTIAPRYSPSAGPEVGQPDAERVNPPTLLTVPFGLTLEIDIESHSPIKCVESPSHTIRTELDSSKARVTLSARDAAMDRDFVLLVESREAHRPVARVCRDEAGERVVMVTFRPGTDELTSDGGQEITFILDCSGSMGGDSITEAKRALELCIRGMDEGDTFNVIPFGSSFRSLWPEARAYNQATLDEAIAFVRDCGANMGGTEILSPMRHVLEKPVDATRPRKVLLLTDGEVSNEDQVIALARAKRQTANVFAFGIGAGCSEHLVRGVAKASRGAAEFIYPGERIEPKVLRTFGRVRTPVLADVRLDWGELRVAATPSEVPPIFGGDAMTVFAKVQGGTGDSVTLRAGERSWTVPLDLEHAKAEPLVPTLWARQRIDELEQDRSARGSNQSRGKSDRKVGRIVDLALAYNLMSAHTSFVAVEDRAEADKTTEQAALRRVPTALTAGWGSQGSLGRGGAVPARARRSITGAAPPPAPMAPSPMREPMPSPAPQFRAGPMAPGGAPPPAQASASPRQQKAKKRAKAEGGLLNRAAEFLGIGGGGAPKGGPPAEAYAESLAFQADDAPAEAMYDCEEEADSGSWSSTSGAGKQSAEPFDAVLALLMTQEASGRFSFSPMATRVLGKETGGAIDRPLKGCQDDEHRAVIITACVVWYLENRCQSRAAEWAMAVKKARRWLAAQPRSFEPAALFSPTA
jgi:Ca-activated chloride channel homolog